MRNIYGILGLALALGGCASIRSWESGNVKEYFIQVDPQLPDSPTYYVDPIDSAVVWSEGGVQVKIRFLNDAMLDAEFDPNFSPYTLTGAHIPDLDYTPPLWTVFDVTVINRTRERVELDPTRAIILLDNGNKLRCRQGVGAWFDKEEYQDYSYLKWGGREGNVRYHASLDRDPIWNKSEYKREKPVRKGSKYNGKLTFPPLPKGTRSFSLVIDDFILAFDRFEVGYGNPTEFANMRFDFNVDHGVRWVEKSK